MLQFECPSCKKKLQASEKHAGRTIVCPECQANATIPGEPPTGAITVAAPTAVTTAKSTRGSTADIDDDGDRPRRRDSETKKAGMGIGMILLLVFGIGGCVVLVVGGLLAALLVPAVSKVREAAARTKTMNHMKQIGLAAHNHHDAFKEFPGPKMRAQQPGIVNAPPPPVVDLSWRVSILPFIEQPVLFNQFEKNVGWDHANNQGFLVQRPMMYESEWRPTPDKTQTHFQYFTGPNSMFPDPMKSVRMQDITDGTSNTFFVAEGQTPVPWTKPADMVVAPNGPLPLPADRFLALLADGSVRIVDRRNVNDGMLRLLIDPRDGQNLPPGVLD